MAWRIRQNGVGDKAAWREGEGKMAWGIRQNGVADKAKWRGG